MAEPESGDLSILAVGDIMLGDSAIKIGHGVGSSIRKHGPGTVFSHIAPLLKGSDMVFGNLEAVLSDKGMTASIKSRSYRGSPGSVDALASAGFTVLNMANNHILEHGAGAFNETRTLLEKKGIHPAGLMGADGRSELVVLELKGRRVGILGYSLRLELSDEELLYARGSGEEIRERIQECRELVDHLILSIHWGAEHIHHPSPKQIRMARSFVDAGVDIILGHHSHMVQGIERYQKAVIAYSLGNFVFDKHQESLRKTYILKLELGSQGIRHEILPVMISKKHRPSPMSPEEAEKFRGQVDDWSQELEEEDLLDQETKQRNYEAKAERIRAGYRKGLRQYFLRNIYRYSPRDAFAMLKGKR